MYFEDDMYNADMFKDIKVAIDCTPVVWQDVVIHGCIMIDLLNVQDYFYIDTILGEKGNPIDYSEWTIYDEFTDGMQRVTDHVIRVKDLWGYVEDQLTSYGIDFESGNPDYHETYFMSAMSLELAVGKYLNYLVEKGFLIYLNTEIGHSDEASYRLSKTFI